MYPFPINVVYAPLMMKSLLIYLPQDKSVIC